MAKLVLFCSALLVAATLCGCVALELSGGLNIDDTVPPARVSTVD